MNKLIKYINSIERLKEFDADAFEEHVDHIIVFRRYEIGLALKCGLLLRKVVMVMPIPYGYKIEKGKAIIDEPRADQIRKIFKGYISGLSYTAAAEAVGLTLSHTSVKKILQNKRYLGDKHYGP